MLSRTVAARKTRNLCQEVNLFPVDATVISEQPVCITCTYQAVCTDPSLSAQEVSWLLQTQSCVSRSLVTYGDEQPQAHGSLPPLQAKIQWRGEQITIVAV